MAFYNENYEQTQVLYAKIISCNEPMPSGERGVKGERVKKDKNELGVGTIMSLVGVIGIVIAAIIGLVLKIRENRNQIRNETNENKPDVEMS